MESREISRELVVWDDATELPPWERLVIAPQVDPPAPMPSFFRRVLNFSRALMSHIARGMPRTPQRIQARRLKICRTNQCGMFRVGDRCAHGKCGCNLAEKISWLDQKCPLDFW